MLAFVLVALGLLTGCGGSDNGERDAEEILDLKLPKVRFRDVTGSAGIRFRHVNGGFGKRLFPETMGSGVAFLDYDNDGKQDILFINSCWWPGHEHKEDSRPRLALYRNKGDGTFEDVTKEAGLDITLYGMGVAAGDIDNDGYIDLFITAVGGCRLLRNVPDGKGGRKFVDVTARSPDLAPKGAWQTEGDFLNRSEPLDFPSSAVFLDYDNDGMLDLFVCHYVTWSPYFDIDQGFSLKDKYPAYGRPSAFPGAVCQLFRNVGGCKFVDVSAQAGVQVTDKRGQPVGKSLGVCVCDPDGDGWPDIVVANDTERNFFFHNQRNGTFKEIGERNGVAYADGTARGAMGIDYGEYRPNRPGIIIGNFANEPDTLLRLDHPKRLLFADVALIEGIAGPSQSTLTFGTFWFDYDLDGRLDILSCNGHLEPNIRLVQPEQSYKQPVQLFWNTGAKRGFALVSARHAGPDLFVPMVGRGCAYADINGDGYLDLVLMENNGPARLLLNEGGAGHHWVRLVLEGNGRTCNRSAIGARVTLTAGGQTQARYVTGARGYLSQSELAVTFGLENVTRIDRVEIYWPGSPERAQVLTDLAVDREHQIRQE
jgi:hypothetical protein